MCPRDQLWRDDACTSWPQNSRFADQANLYPFSMRQDYMSDSGKSWLVTVENRPLSPLTRIKDRVSGEQGVPSGTICKLDHRRAAQ